VLPGGGARATLTATHPIPATHVADKECPS